MKRFIIKPLKLGARIGIFGALYWYGINAVHDPNNLDKFIIGLTVFGVTYGISKPLFEVVSEVIGGTMVIAEFLNRHLLEPQKQRLLEEGRKQAHDAAHAEAEARLDEARARLRALGLDPDEILPDENDELSSDQG